MGQDGRVPREKPYSYSLSLILGNYEVAKVNICFVARALRWSHSFFMRFLCVP